MIRRHSAAKRVGCGCLALAITALVCLTAVWLSRTGILTSAGAFLVEDDGPHRADAIVVLGGDEYGERLLTAAKLATAGYAPYVLISLQPRFVPYCDDTKLLAESKGYPDTLFREFPNAAHSTRTEVHDLDTYFRAHGIRRILLVTSNYHTRRAAALMRAEDRSLQVWVDPAPDPYFTPATWWKTREGQKTFLYESMKTVATFLGK